ncbi:MAG: aromatic ring-opening dioxygenase subunit LigA [Woeseiaceae bacterium]|nr:aromatic ring-opening dioxygenase subunit LigA [Woeseiaceae bacterium]
MSLYYLQKFLYELNRDENAQQRYKDDLDDLLSNYDLSDEERSALVEGDIGLLYVLGVNGQILMHYAAFLGIEWFDYLDMMRAGTEKHGPVRDGVYAMTGGGDSFTTEGEQRGQEKNR